LIDSSASVTQTGDTAWTLEKSGSLSGNTVTWNITANSTPVASGQLSIQGHMTVFNFGSGPATIGNIVVNLQKRVGSKWVTQSSNIADATNGDAATSASIHAAASSEKKSTFSENSASGELNFMDATNNTIFSLVPQVSIEAGQSRSLLFQASFDNEVLNLPAGTTIRAEIIVSFGHATANGNSTPNIDINGNGIIDSDENRVRSVPTRLTLAVPAQVPGNATVTLSDTLSDITSTGTVQFTNVVINLGSTTGTVTATVDGGTSGGTITNCAHLTSASSTVTNGGFTFPNITGINLTACNTQSIDPALPCVPGTVGCGWRTGDIVTHTQDNWGIDSMSPGTGAALLNSSFATVYPGGYVEVGLSGSAGFSMIFASASALIAYLPASTLPPGPLDSDLIDPTSSASRIFGGHVTGLRLNLDFSGITGGTSGIALGSLSLCGLASPLDSLNGLTINQYYDLVATLLGGGAAPGYPSIADLSPVTFDINIAFATGAPSTFAQAHIVNGACP